MVTANTPQKPDRLNTRRLELGITLENLAATSGIPRTTLSTKLADLNRFQLGELRLICRALDVPLSSAIA